MTPHKFDTQRYYLAKLLIGKLSIDRRSVLIVDSYLTAILKIEDAINLEGEKLLDCIKTKFVLVQDLARSCHIGV